MLNPGSLTRMRSTLVPRVLLARYTSATRASHDLHTGVTRGLFDNKTSRPALSVPSVVSVSPKVLDRNEFAKGPPLSDARVKQWHRDTSAQPD
jgi:hypothetical protein